MRRFAVLGVALAVLLLPGCASRHESTKPILLGPSFHSAGARAKDELQAVLDSQAKSILASDWRSYYQLYVPTERRRCDYPEFATMAEQVFGGLRDQAAGSTLVADVTDMKINGFRAAVDYRLVLPDFGLATQPQTAHYVKLVDRWFLDEKAC